MKYHTKQRDAVLRFFMDHEEQCFTAREVYEQVDAGEATGKYVVLTEVLHCFFILGLR